jgi:hypothetical protein
VLHATFDPASGRCSVEFRLPPEVDAERAWLAGDFNDWSTTATPLTPQGDGSLAVTLLLEPGRSHRFRYYFGDGRWENDWAADAYVDNHHGGADSVVVTPPPPASSPPEPLVRRAAPTPPAAAPAPPPPEADPAAPQAEPAEAAEPEPAADADGGTELVPAGRVAVSRWRQLAVMGVVLAGVVVLRGRHRSIRRRR